MRRDPVVARLARAIGSALAALMLGAAFAGAQGTREFELSDPEGSFSEVSSSGASAQAIDADRGASLGGAGVVSGGDGGGPIGHLAPLRPKLLAGGSGGVGVTSERDPGKGLWMPKGTSNLFVVDPGNVLRNTGSQHLPGSINLNGSTRFPDIEAARPGWQYSMDYYSYPPTGTIVSFRPGNTVSLRFRTAAKTSRTNNPPAMAPGSIFGLFSFREAHGDGFPWSATISASVRPGDFSDPKCTLSFVLNRGPHLAVTSHPPLTAMPAGYVSCIMAPNTDYYLNIRIDNRNGRAVTRRVFDRKLGHYVWTALTDAEIMNADCTRSEIWCPLVRLNSIGDAEGYFGGSDPFAPSASNP